MMAPIGMAEAQSQADPATPEVREVIRCKHCSMQQFRTSNDLCRRCKKSLLPEPPKAQPAIALVPEPIVGERTGTLQVSAAVRDLRHVRKAMPTLCSLDRLARALQVDISALLRDAPTRHRDESAVLLGDPFLAEIARYTAHLNETQKSIFLNHVRELAQGRTRKLA